MNFIERSPDVGYSDKRTPAKHRILRAHAGRDIGAAPYAAKKIGRIYSGHRIVDLTAGDATQDSINPWERGSSPAIFATLAAQNQNVRVDLYEINPSTFDRLIHNLTMQLPSLGYSQLSEQEWHHSYRNSRVKAIRGDGSQETFNNLEFGEWLYINNDPNNMDGWTLDMESLYIVRQTKVATFMSTMGCNSGGLKRLPRNRRDVWFEHIKRAVDIVRKITWLDLLIFEITNDAAQWAYLQLIPRKWTAGTVKDMAKHFNDEQLDVLAVSFWDDQDGFWEVCKRLFLTKKEREEDAA